MKTSKEQKSYAYKICTESPDITGNGENFYYYFFFVGVNDQLK